MATTRRTQEDLRAAWHCCRAGPDISAEGPNPAPMTACLYDPGAAGPTSQWDPRRWQVRHQSAPGVGQTLSRGPRTINQM